MAMIELSKWAKIHDKDPALARQKALRGTVPAVKIGSCWMIEESTPWKAASLSMVKVHIADGFFSLHHAGEEHICIRNKNIDEIQQIAEFVASIIKCNVIKIKCDLYEIKKLNMLGDELRKHYDAVNLSYLDKPIMPGVENQGFIFMGEYLHYNQIVRMFRKDSSFTDVLMENQLTYEELPIIDADVVRFLYNNKIVYACSKSLAVGNIIYFTEVYPADADWESLITDIHNQSQFNKEPMAKPSKAGVIIKSATESMRKYIPIDSEMKRDSLRIFTETELSLVKDMISKMGYSVEELKKMDHHDVDESMLKLLITG